MHEQTPKAHIESNIEMAMDQSHEYDSTPEWREGDAYCQNTCDSMLEDGYTPDEASAAADAFCSEGRKRGIRFA